MDQVPWYISLIVAWLPFIAWILSVIWAARRVTRPLITADGRSLASVTEDYVREMKRANDLAEQALAEYGKRLERLEQRN